MNKQFFNFDLKNSFNYIIFFTSEIKNYFLSNSKGIVFDYQIINSWSCSCCRCSIYFSRGNNYFSKKFTLQETTEQDLIDLKDNTISQLENGIDDTSHEVSNKIQDTINNLFDKT